MIITTIVENTTISEELEKQHGLCFHVKTDRHNILFDLGDKDLFLKNAKKLNIDIAEVDIVIISHGHYDHGGGLKYLLENNDKAKIYIQREAFNKHLIKILGVFKYNIGLDEELKDNSRIILTDNLTEIDDELLLFSGGMNNRLIPTANKELLMIMDNKCVSDDFNHEQSLLLKNNGKVTLISGCAHNGIVNILERAEEIIGCELDVVISGLHTIRSNSGKYKERQLINDICAEIAKRKSKFYTCHCTGIQVYDILKDKLSNQIEYLSTGRVVDINVTCSSENTN
ncbi:MAG: MBL fold metallo-hydrolase [Clostridium sp.]|uniref:MBL fold metallo-hydrolase n=1 Tax=Clostridium sp. TaxID=1506 RepID=UPI00302A65B3